MAFKPKALDKTKIDRPFFDNNNVKLKNPQYVCWVDLMGMASSLSISNLRSAIFIGKFHDSIIRSKLSTGFNGHIYPIIDGCYIVTENRTELQALLKSILKMNALSFIHEQENLNKYMLRASISFGQVIEGVDISDAAPSFDQLKDYSNGILLGTPLALAYSAEKYASPFGVWIEESARHFCPVGGQTIRRTFWEWWTYPSKIDDLDKDCDQIEHILAEELSNYLKWCERNSHKIIYPLEAIRRHQAIASQYFGSWPKG